MHSFFSLQEQKRNHVCVKQGTRILRFSDAFQWTIKSSGNELENDEASWNGLSRRQGTELANSQGIG